MEFGEYGDRLDANGNSLINEQLGIEGSKPHKSGMSKKKKTTIGIVAGAVALLVILACVFVGVAQSYEDRFLPNTYVQGVDVSGMGIDDAKTAINGELASSTVTIEEDGRDDIVITSEDVDMRYVPGEIDDVLSSQDKWSWLAAFLGGKQEHSVGVEYSVEKLDEVVAGLGLDADETRADAVNSSIAYDEETDAFAATESAPGTKVDTVEVESAISQLIANGGGVLQMSDFYAQPQYVEDSDEIVAAADKANSVINKTIKYNIDGIDDAETLTKEQIVSFVTLGDDMTLSVDEAAVAAWLREIGKEYDTVGQEIRYTTVYGKEAVLPTGTLGWITDEAAMLPIVKENILSNDNVIDQDFMYQREGVVPKGENGFGNKYVDIDLTDQRVRLIENGAIVHDLVTVTGSNDGRHNTPEGAWYIDFKSAPYLMIGADENRDGKPDYKTETECFANFISGCALHEMQSRSSWSPTAWLRGGGSHGCANLKRNDAWTAYNFVEIGTPVLVHM